MYCRYYVLRLNSLYSDDFGCYIFIHSCLLVIQDFAWIMLSKIGGVNVRAREEAELQFYLSDNTFSYELCDWISENVSTFHVISW